MPTHQLDTTQFDCTELSPYHKNPRQGDIQTIARSLEINGQYRPIVVNIGTHTGRPLEILAGNHTWKAAQTLGWPTITATTIDVDNIAAARIVAADNRTADLGGYDTGMLQELLAPLPDLDGTGYTTETLDEILAAADPQTLPEPYDSGITDTYQERWEIIIECDGETQQETLYNQLTAEGLTCRVLTL